jgi:hypothetical protein
MLTGGPFMLTGAGQVKQEFDGFANRSSAAWDASMTNANSHMNVPFSPLSFFPLAIAPTGSRQ